MCKSKPPFGSCTRQHVDMKTVAIISQKGGVGKTTVALHLAVSAERDNQPTVIIDLDSQASASTWKDLWEDESPVVQPAQVNRLGVLLEEANRQGATFVVIDTSPNSESASLAAARAADLVLTPYRRRWLDLKAIGSSIEFALFAPWAPLGSPQNPPQSQTTQGLPTRQPLYYLW